MIRRMGCSSRMMVMETWMIRDDSDDDGGAENRANDKHCAECGHDDDCDNDLVFQG